MFLDDFDGMNMEEGKEKTMETENMGEKTNPEKKEGTVSPGSEEYFSEIRSTEMNPEKTTDSEIQNVGGEPKKDEEFHSEINPPWHEEEHTSVDYLDPDEDTDFSNDKV